MTGAARLIAMQQPTEAALQTAIAILRGGGDMSGEAFVEATLPVVAEACALYETGKSKEDVEAALVAHGLDAGAAEVLTAKAIEIVEANRQSGQHGEIQGKQKLLEHPHLRPAARPRTRLGRPVFSLNGLPRGASPCAGSARSGTPPAICTSRPAGCGAPVCTLAVIHQTSLPHRMAFTCPRRMMFRHASRWALRMRRH